MNAPPPSHAVLHSERHAMNKHLPSILLAGFVSANASSANQEIQANQANHADAAEPAARQSRQAAASLVTGRPYSVIQTVTIRRLLPDGDEFTRQTVMRLYRDSAGRTRQDTLDSEGELDHSVVTGLDGATIFLDHQNQLATAGARRPAAALDREGDPAQASAAKAGAAVEQLGQRDIEGVSATGRMVRTRVGGEGENIEVTKESWYAEEIGMTLYRRHSDPRSGESIVELSELDRSEPDPALFEAPEDYELLASHYRKN